MNFDNVSTSYHQDELYQVTRCSSNNCTQKHSYPPFPLTIETNTNLQYSYDKNYNSLTFVEQGYTQPLNTKFHAKNTQINDFNLFQTSLSSDFEHTKYEKFKFDQHKTS